VKGDLGTNSKLYIYGEFRFITILYIASRILAVIVLDASTLGSPKMPKLAHGALPDVPWFTAVQLAHFNA
jgi:hypothetical protein